MLANLLTSLRNIHRRSRRQRRQNHPHGQWQIQALEPRLLLSTISGRVWLDSNINGIQDAAINGVPSSYEDGIAAITVLLYNSTNTQVGSQTTDANGEFSFTDLLTGDYYLKYPKSILVDNTSMQLTFQDVLYGGVNLQTMDSDAHTITGETYHQADHTKWIQLDGTNTVDDQAAGYAPIFDLTSMTAAVIGQQYNFSVNLSLPDYLNNPEASIDFFLDDSMDNAITLTDPTYHNSQGDLIVTLDYSYDTNNFFDTQFKRDLMQYAASTIANQFGDTLAAITTTDTDKYNQTFFQPNSTSNMAISVPGTSLQTNELLIYLGSVNEHSSTLGTGGHGGHNYDGLPKPSQSFDNTVYARGQSGALTDEDSQKTDYSLWGGSISFNGTPFDNDNTQFNWYYGLDTSISSNNEADFLSVAMHEMMHVMGFGSAATWDNYSSTGQFTGPATTAYVTTNPLPSISPDGGHFADGTLDPYSNLETAMDPILQIGTRKYPTGLDNAVLDDIGWDLLVAPTISSNGVVESSYTYDTLGTNTITLTIVTANGNLTYQLDIDVIDALQVYNDVQVNEAGYDNGEVPTNYYSQTMQRSVLQSIVVTFTRAVDNLTSDDVVLKRINQDGSTATQSLDNANAIASFTSDDHITWTIDLRDIQLSDSVYELLINDTVIDTLTGVALDGDKDGTTGGTYVSQTFHQLGGDFNGDGQYNQYDLSALAHYWNGYNPNPPSYVNINGDSVVNTADTIHFAQWMEKLDLTVQEVVVAPLVALSVSPPATSSNTLASALAAYGNKQASLTVVSSDTDNADAVTYEDIIGQWLI